MSGKNNKMSESKLVVLGAAGVGKSGEILKIIIQFYSKI